MSTQRDWWMAHVLWATHARSGDPGWRQLSREEKDAWRTIAVLADGMGWEPKQPAMQFGYPVGNV